MKYLNTLNAVQERLDSLGDLPVFSATVNRISQISTSRKSDAMALAMAVMKDASLSARLLRLANSSYYNRGNGRVNVVSRAVVMLGFDQIKSLSVTLKLIEGFNQEEDEEISELLMRSFMTATIAREVAELCAVTDVEETYICGLLHGLGEILVAYTLPKTYKRMHQQLEQDADGWSHIQLEHLGAHFSDIGQDIAQSWGFPSSVVQSMDLMTAEDHPGSIHGNYQMASMADQILKSIYGQPQESGLDFNQQLKQMEETTGQTSERLTQCLNNAFKLACDMAQEYNLPGETLVPPLRDSGDEALDEFTRKISYYMHTREQQQEKAENLSEQAPTTALREAKPATEQLLEQLQLIGNMVTEHQPIHQVLSQVLTAIVDCTGFQRAAFCLLSKDHKSLNVRIHKGQQSDGLEKYFHLQNDKQGGFIFKILAKGMTLLVTDTEEGDWSERLPRHFTQTLNPSGFIISPLSVGQRTIGFIYADRLPHQGPISDEDFRRFNQFYLQTKMALAYNNQAHKSKS